MFVGALLPFSLDSARCYQAVASLRQRSEGLISVERDARLDQDFIKRVAHLMHPKRGAFVVGQRRLLLERWSVKWSLRERQITGASKKSPAGKYGKKHLRIGKRL